jgi:hypothetical protein
MIGITIGRRKVLGRKTQCCFAHHKSLELNARVCNKNPAAPPQPRHGTSNTRAENWV